MLNVNLQGWIPNPSKSKHIQITKIYPLSRGCVPGRAHPPIGLCSSYSFRWLFGSLQNRGPKGAGSEWVFLSWQVAMDLSATKSVWCLFFASKMFFFLKVEFRIYNQNSFWRSSLCVFRSFIHRKNDPFSDSSLQHSSPTLPTLL